MAFNYRFLIGAGPGQNPAPGPAKGPCSLEMNDLGGDLCENSIKGGHCGVQTQVITDLPVHSGQTLPPKDRRCGGLAPDPHPLSD